MREIEFARYGEIVTLDARGEANEKVNRQVRYQQIIRLLKELGKATAKELAVEMFNRGWIPTPERNFTAPRLTELSVDGKVEPIGKVKCEYTGRTVSVYELRKEQHASN